MNLGSQVGARLVNDNTGTASSTASDYDLKDSKSFKMLELATRAELASINDFLKIAGIQNDQDGIIRPDQLSRQNAEEEEREEISKALAVKSNLVTASIARVTHEANRCRRDISIAQASHKRLMLGIYQTMYQRKLKLERCIQEESYV